ncbi:MAG: 4-(cytidine 5'-diphospho)-2-C-methyl-D-erythritol kinase [Hyphomicrobiaceae bacterium]
MTAITEVARAKINLTLRVLGRRADGFHVLESLVVFADVADRLTLDPDQPDGISMAGPTAPNVVGDNLVAHVLSRAQAVAPDLVIGHLHLEKHLPVAAGIGGGSADAAAALRAVLRRHPGDRRLKRLACESQALGADIPACLVSQALIMRGIGEEVMPITHFAPIDAVLVNPGLPLATADVFRALAAAPLTSAPQPSDWPEAIGGLDDLLALIGGRANELEPPARRLLPVIDTVLAAVGRQPGCRLARMSGSGPTCFGLFENARAAAAAATTLKTAQPGWWVAATRLA